MWEVKTTEKYSLHLPDYSFYNVCTVEIIPLLFDLYLYYSTFTLKVIMIYMMFVQNIDTDMS